MENDSEGVKHNVGLILFILSGRLVSDQSVIASASLMQLLRAAKLEARASSCTSLSQHFPHDAAS